MARTLAEADAQAIETPDDVARLPSWLLDRLHPREPFEERPLEQLQRCVEPQQLLHRGWKRAVVRTQPLQLVRVAEQCPPADQRGVHGGFVAGVEQQHARPDELILGCRVVRDRHRGPQLLVHGIGVGHERDVLGAKRMPGGYRPTAEATGAARGTTLSRSLREGRMHTEITFVDGKAADFDETADVKMTP